MSEAKVYSAKMDKISDRVMKGETPLQAVARQGITPATEARGGHGTRAGPAWRAGDLREPQQGAPG